ncbi:MAG: energy transducer TonB [Chlorobium sp.]
MKKFYLWLAVAAAMHATVLCAAYFFQIWDAGNNVKPKIVSVTLVSLPAPAGGTPGLSDGEGGAEEVPASTLTMPAPSPAVKQAVQQPVAKEPQQQPQQSLSPKIVVEKSPASQPADNQLQKALDRIKQRVYQKTPPQQPSSVSALNSTLARLQQKVNSAGAGTGSVSGGKGVGDNGGKGYGTGGTSKSYKAAVAMIIQKNWEFSGTLLKNRDGMAVYVRINILPDGTISQILFDRKAVSEYLNNSVKKAIEKSSPLPVLPKEEGSRDVWIGFVFSPEGIEK